MENKWTSWAQTFKTRQTTTKLPCTYLLVSTYSISFDISRLVVNYKLMFNQTKGHIQHVVHRVHETAYWFGGPSEENFSPY